MSLSFVTAVLLQLRNGVDGLTNASQNRGMSAASAQMARKRLLDGLCRWPLLSCNELVRGDEYSTQAIAALACANADKFSAKNVRDGSRDAFDRSNVLAGRVGDQVRA